MKILVATTNFPSQAEPFRGVFLERDVKGLARNGHEVTCLVARSRLRGGSPYTSTTQGLLVREARYLSLSYVRGLEYWFGAFAQHNSTRALRRLLQHEIDFDVVYAKFLNTAPLLRYVPPGTARVLGMGEGVDSIYGRMAFFRRSHFAACLRAADIIEVKNQEVADWLQEYHPDCAPAVRIVPSGVDTAFFAPGNRESARATLGVDRDAFVISFVGARTVNKGGDRVLAASRAATSRPLPIMVGPGWTADAADDWLGLGMVPEETVRTALQASDVFVLPSLSEGMPNALLEALSCGVPSIVSDRPYNAFLQHGSNCLKIDPASEESVRAAIDQLAQSPSLRRSIGDAGRLAAASLSQERRIQSVESCLKAAIDRRGYAR
ncbi:MAG TPA: glycosyltransferase family 4 protein [Longimicrobiales bacterium]|nr:glycosyltransferase family 4 protein [Longimicrobiales bacterium]